MLKNGLLRVIMITHDSNEEIKYDVFMRLNTGSVHLTEQELRNCLYRGNLNKLLKDFSQNKIWQTLLGLNEPHKRMADRELALRFLAIYKNWDTTDFIGSTLDTELTYLYEYHPRSCNKPAMDWSYPDTQYLYLTLSAPDYWLVPTLEIEYNIDDQQDSKGAIYATFDVHHEYDIGAAMGLDEEFMTLTPTLGIGFGNKHRNAADFYDYYEETGEKVDNFMLRDAYARLELYINPFEGFSISPYIGINQQIDNDAREATGDDDFVAYAGLGFYYEM
jgi:hypothetical protein